jgi:hypothetical protein
LIDVDVNSPLCFSILSPPSLYHTLFPLAYTHSPDRACSVFVQLVCFYFVFTTFTTVGYGMSMVESISISATLISLLNSYPSFVSQAIFMLHQMQRGLVPVRHVSAIFPAQSILCSDDKLYALHDFRIATGVLCFPVHEQCVSLWDSGLANQRDRSCKASQD